jgi:hypothetical protein
MANSTAPAGSDAWELLTTQNTGTGGGSFLELGHGSIVIEINDSDVVISRQHDEITLESNDTDAQLGLGNQTANIEER